MKRAVLALLIAVPILLTLSSRVACEAGREVVVETFLDQSAFYDGWKIKKWDGVVRLSFLKSGEMPFLQLDCDNSSWAFIKQLDVDLAVTPMLAWSWKADQFPPGGDGRSDPTDDEVAQMYVFFPGTGMFPRLNPRIVGYTWETVPEAGTYYVSPKNENTRVFVLRSERDGAGSWKQEARDVAADFQKAYGIPAPKPGALCFQIDSSDTKSRAKSCFADIKFRSR